MQNDYGDIKCKSFFGHRYRSFKNRSDRLCVRCGHIQVLDTDMFGMNYGWYPKGYAKDKDALLSKWIDVERQWKNDKPLRQSRREEVFRRNQIE